MLIVLDLVGFVFGFDVDYVRYLDLVGFVFGLRLILVYWFIGWFPVILFNFILEDCLNIFGLMLFLFEDYSILFENSKRNC